MPWLQAWLWELAIEEEIQEFLPNGFKINRMDSFTIYQLLIAF